MSKQFKIPRGTADILPEEWAKYWLNVEGVAYCFCENYGYKQIRTPIFEETELFARSMGATSDVVNKQMLNISSQKEGEESSGLSLRPEGTAAVVRSYIQNRLDKKESLSKLFYIGPMFRGERPQKGRLRQFHQIGVEAIGPNSISPYLDAEVIALGAHLLDVMGVKSYKVLINTLGTQEDKQKFSDLLREKLKPHVSKLSEYSQQRYERNVFRILDSKEKQDQAIIQQLDIGQSYLSEESKKYFEEVKRLLDTLNISYEFDPNLVRGLDYYTHTVFEFIDTSSSSAQNALGAGGRYNRLVEQLGGPQVDAIGFALGIERIILALPDDGKDIRRRCTYVIAMDDSCVETTFDLAHALRKAGFKVETSYKVSSMKSQMRQANKLNASLVIIIGEEEIKKEAVTVKDMDEGTQEEISIKNNNYKELMQKISDVNQRS